MLLLLLKKVVIFSYILCRYEVEVPEDIGPGSTLAWIQATDIDSGAYGTTGIRFTRISGPMARYLELNGETGESQ